jgi:PilZ domain
MIVEWRVVDGGLYQKSKLINFSSGGVAVVSDRPLQNNQGLAFRFRLATGPEYIMGRVTHTSEISDGDFVTGVRLEFLNEERQGLFQRRVSELKERRRNRTLCHL